MNLVKISYLANNATSHRLGSRCGLHYTLRNGLPLVSMGAHPELNVVQKADGLGQQLSQYLRGGDAGSDAPATPPCIEARSPFHHQTICSANYATRDIRGLLEA